MMTMTTTMMIVIVIVMVVVVAVVVMMTGGHTLVAGVPFMRVVAARSVSPTGFHP